MRSDRKIVYGPIAYSDDGHLTFLREREARHFHQVFRAVNGASTWGDFWALLPEDDRLELQEDMTLDGDPLPPDDESFEAVRLPGVPDGDFPPPGHVDGSGWMPIEIQRLYGVDCVSLLSGDWVEYPPEREAEIVAALQSSGYEVRRDDELVFGATGGHTS